MRLLNGVGSLRPPACCPMSRPAESARGRALVAPGDTLSCGPLSQRAASRGRISMQPMWRTAGTSTNAQPPTSGQLMRSTAHSTHEEGTSRVGAPMPCRAPLAEGGWHSQRSSEQATAWPPGPGCCSCTTTCRTSEFPPGQRGPSWVLLRIGDSNTTRGPPASRPVAACISWHRTKDGGTPLLGTPQPQHAWPCSCAASAALPLLRANTAALTLARPLARCCCCQ
mmetsp:Transcript_25642/g.71712  ORF Transcript_25642/g.71712 Transcript_25642/m.71712 type:complete len:225 (+) Transcript_25642:704-1378(+)